MRVVLAVGTTRTAEIEGLSAAGADPEAMVHTPSADAEIVSYGEPVRSPVVPVSPTGCPTPAVVTRAVRDLVGFDVTVVDAGLAEPTGAPTVTVGARSGDDIREADPVPTAPGAFAAAREFGQALPDDEVYLGESIPGGTTTALGVQAALGERSATADGASVSSSLPENPVERKEAVVDEGLAASGLAEGDLSGDPREAIRRMGDPVLAVLSGLALGCLESGTAVTLAGGTQLATVAAVLRHAGEERPLDLATTQYVADDPSVDLGALADAFDLSVTATDPAFDAGDHPAFDGYVAGEAKEGVAMGGALALARTAGVSDADVRERVLERYRSLPLDA
ncbi:nicotinate-nucleotide--dimethylbenzimidazole phosphoribosyltransferase [Halosimplex aquaticum]|uniref:nicotinate-nucleotide--dimethylbenzimidazole phosphoribosyltransferase n=1 Tax=Halosimplex aquaticum TaxID=3026162 RepID=UPI002367878F|nr:nicotinate-nucleotide--dimethylbenzimidazole phosphoribosyltransferase [Halosimplex aquaticum]